MTQPNAALAAIDRVRAISEPARRLINEVENSPVAVAARDIRARIAALQPETIPMPDLRPRP